MAKPENLSLFNKLFNNIRREVIERGKEIWHLNYSRDSWYYACQKVPNSEYKRDFVVYKIITRSTGSEKIEKVYLN